MSRPNVTGGWVELRDPKLVPERLRRPIVTRASDIGSKAREIADAGVDQAASMVDAATLTGMFEFNDLLVVALVKEWSFESAITVDGLLDLPGGVYDELQRIVTPLLSDVMPSFEPAQEPDSPTESSGA